MPTLRKKRKETRVGRLYRGSELFVSSEEVVEGSETSFGSRDGSSVDEESEDSKSWCENEYEEVGGRDHRIVSCLGGKVDLRGWMGWFEESVGGWKEEREEDWKGRGKGWRD